MKSVYNTPDLEVKSLCLSIDILRDSRDEPIDKPVIPDPIDPFGDL